MSKRKVALTVSSTATDENDGGWLSTRNKKKICPAPSKAPGRARSLNRFFPRSPLLTLMENTPETPLTIKKQTCIADFFSSRLKDLPSRDNADPPSIHPHRNSDHSEETGVCGDDKEEMVYLDFDMPVPSQEKTTTQCVSQQSLPVASASTAEITLTPSCSKVSDATFQHNVCRNQLHDEEQSKAKYGNFTYLEQRLNEQSLNEHPSLERKPAAGSDKHSLVSDEKVLTVNEDSADSLLTPEFLKETHSSLTSNDQSAAIIPSSSETGCMRHKAELYDSSDQSQIFSSQTQEEDSLSFSSFTDSKSDNFSDLKSLTFSDSTQAQAVSSQQGLSLKQSSEEHHATRLNQSLAPCLSCQDEEHGNSMMTPAFLSSEVDCGGYTEEGTEGLRWETQLTLSSQPALCDDLHTPGFLHDHSSY